jgi:predicted transcriptional regulator YdeE
MTTNMDFKHTEESGFFVSGIEVRTTNSNGQSQKDIGGLWTKFMTENIADKIPAKLSDDIYCVYTDFETDHTGWYTAVIGCQVSEAGDIADWFTALVPEGSYRVYEPRGKFPDCVANTWMQIWQDGIDRAYLADYDLYKAGVKSFEETEVEVHLGVI